jgi:putative membrane protein
MRRLHPATMVVAFLPKLAEAVRSMLPVILISFARSSGDYSEMIVALIGVLGGFGAIGVYISTRFEVEDDQLIHKSGIFFRRDRRIPLGQIQNVNIKQGLLERLLKVVTLEVETAASTGAELKLQVLSEHEAERLKAELTEGHQHREEEQPVEEIYRVSRQDLLLGALTENEAWRLIIILIPLISGGGLIRALMKEGVLAGAFIPWWVWLIAGACAVYAVMLAGWAWGAVTYALKYGGFTVRREPGIYRISHGTLTKLQFVLRLRRVEFVSVSATLWQRWIGRCTVNVGTAATFGEQGALLPIGLMLAREDAGRVVDAVVPGAGLDRIQWRPIPRYYLRVLMMRQVITAAFFMVTWFVISQSPIHALLKSTLGWVLVFPGMFIALGVIGGLITAKASAYALEENILAVRHGFFRQFIQFIPLERIESMRSSEPAWWRRRGVTSIHARAMIHQVAIPMAPIEFATALTEEIRSLGAERGRSRRARRTALVETAEPIVGMGALPEARQSPQ